MFKKDDGAPFTQRQLRVGEMIKQALGMLFIRDEAKLPNVSTKEITVTEVRMSPDLKTVNTSGCEILIQNMAPFPWHFGGQRYQNIFIESEEIIKWCEELNMRICFDVSHSKLACNYLKKDFYNFSSDIAKYAAHIHVGDAQKFNGLTGYLVTITTEQENDWIADKIATSAWTGGSDSGTERTWKWMDGPEAGQSYTCAKQPLLNVGGHGATISGCSEQSYLNWREPTNGNLEPNDHNRTNEDYMLSLIHI